MDWDDIVYLILLFSSIGFGNFYRKIEDVNQKQLIGSLVGLGIIFVVSGIHIIHIFLFIFVNILILFFVNKRLCHLVSFAFSFSYLLFFRTTVYFGIPYPPAHTNLVIMILTLKLVGLGFELNTTYMKKKDFDKIKDEEALSEHSVTNIDPSFTDILHYSLNYIGVLTGPYYSFRTYWDSLHLPYSKYASCKDATLEKLTYVPLYAVLFLWATYTWPLSYALSDEFYNERSWLYRLWYTVPIFFIFRMRIYIGIILSECVCTMAGLGAYPKFTNPKPGKGPSTNFTKLKKLEGTSDKDFKEDFNFETIHNIQPYETETCTTFREAMKHWNMCVQYWMAVNIYKRFPNKQFRTLVTLFVSSVWHGVYIGHYFCICGAPFYLPVEDLYYKLLITYNNNEKSKKIWEWIICIVKMCAFSYLGMAFQLLTVAKVLHFYNSIYHFGAVAAASMYVLGIFLLKNRKKSFVDLKETKKID